MYTNWKDILCILFIATVFGIILHFGLSASETRDETEAIIDNTEAIVKDTKCQEDLLSTRTKLWKTISELDNCRQDELLRSIGCIPTKE